MRTYSELPATILCDFYKISHRRQYDNDTRRVYSTWTARGSRFDDIQSVVVLGYQGFVQKYLIEYFNRNFFGRDVEEVIAEYVRYIKFTLNDSNPDSQHLRDLHALGYLPLLIESVEEGTVVPMRVPTLTIINTDDRFFWLTNFIETLFSCEVWQPTTSATIAHSYRQILDSWAEKTCDNNEHVDFQGHDFSMRGMPCLEASMTSGLGHLLSFRGTDTIPAIWYAETYYNANIEKELVGTSIPASEHSVVETNGKDEIKTVKRLLTEVYPTGIFSYVADTWNLWDNLTKTLPTLHKEIVERDGKIVIRPDSGDPVDIICGEINEAWHPVNGLVVVPVEGEYALERAKGVIELLWDEFGGSTNSKGYKVLDPHVGAIYGDAITRERAEQICQRLADKGFASSNIVFGIGSFTYTYNTRDTFGFALKSTYAVKGDEEKMIYKDPITDNGLKKSQKGMVAVIDDQEEGIKFIDHLFNTDYEVFKKINLLTPLFKDGNLMKETSLSEIRERVVSYSKDKVSA